MIFLEGEALAMSMHKINYSIKLSGSQLFDMVMYNTAKKLCMDCPGLDFDYDITNIYVYGELDDENYARYQEEMFGKTGETPAE